MCKVCSAEELSAASRLLDRLRPARCLHSHQDQLDKMHLLQVKGFGRLEPNRRAVRVAAGEYSAVVLTEAGEVRLQLAEGESHLVQIACVKLVACTESVRERQGKL